MFNPLKYVPVIGPMFQAADQKEAYDNMMKMSSADQQGIQSFWRGQQQHAEANYAPLQQMFKNAYGNTGMAAPVMPPRAGGR